MRIGIIGSGAVGQSLGAKFSELGHDVVVGSREPAKLGAWVSRTAGAAAAGTFADAAEHGELVFLATLWAGTRNALELAGRARLSGKTVVDVTNPLDSSDGTPKLAVGFSESAGELVQGLLPGARVVKALNTVGAHIMVDPAGVTGDRPTMFIAGDDRTAKREVTAIVESLGWTDIVDLGELRTARYLESLGMVWITHWVTTHSANHALKLVGR
jgi:8-hydroxy-5-deazaflavin:NADPH oxidoreductase